MIQHYRALLAASMPGIAMNGDQLPADIQWMPPGRQKITCLNPNTGKPVDLEIDVTETGAKVVAAQLQHLRAKAAEGVGDLPFIDFNHEDAAAAGHPTEAFWGGTDPKAGGIRMKMDWSKPGQEALIGKAFRRFSPEFLADPNAKALAGLRGVNVGGLVNKAAFQTIQEFWSRNGGEVLADGHYQQKPTTEDTMTEVQAKQLADVVTAVAALSTKVDGFISAQAKAGNAASDPKILVLETQMATVNNLLQLQARNTAKAIVEKHINLGRIPAQAKDVIANWENLIAADAKNEALLEAIPANPALARVIQGSGSGGAGTGTPTEHPFVVKAKEYAKANNITDVIDAQAKFATTAEGSQLYTQYRESLAAPTK